MRTPTSEMRLLDESTARTDAATPPSPPPRSLGRAGRVRFPRLARQVRIRSLGRVGSSEGHVTPFPQGSCHLTSPRDLDHCRIGAFSCCFPPFLPAPHAPLPQPGPRPSLLPWVLDFARLRSAAGAFIFFFFFCCVRAFFFFLPFLLSYLSAGLARTPRNAVPLPSLQRPHAPRVLPEDGTNGVPPQAFPHSSSQRENKNGAATLSGQTASLSLPPSAVSLAPPSHTASPQPQAA